MRPTHQQSPTQFFGIPTNSYQAIYLSGILLISSFLLIRVLRFYVADQTFAAGSTALELGDLNNAVPQLLKAHQIIKNESTYTDQLALALAQAAVGFAQNQQAESALNFAQQAYLVSNQTIALNPVNINFYKTRARTLIFLTQIDGQYLMPAIDTLKASIALAPTDAKLYYNLGLLYQQTQKLDEAEKLYQQTLNLKPNYLAAQQASQELLRQTKASQSATPN